MSWARGRASVRGHGGAVGGGAGGAAGSRRQVPARRRAAWPVEGCGCRSAGRGERGGSQAAPRLRWAGRWQPRAPSCGGSCRALSLFAGPWRGSWRVACSRCCLCVVSVVAGLGDGVGKRGAPSGWEVLLLASLCGVLLQARSATARSWGCGCRSAGRGERGGSQAAPLLPWAGRWQPRAPSCGGNSRALSLFVGTWRGSWRLACSRCVLSIVAGLGDAVGKRRAASGWEVLLLVSLCGVLLKARSATARSCGWRGLILQQGWRQHRLATCGVTRQSLEAEPERPAPTHCGQMLLLSGLLNQQCQGFFSVCVAVAGSLCS